jgi:hypothetical protein
MWDLVEGVINLIAGIWRTDCDLRNSSAMTAGSKFERDSRAFVALLCAGVIALIVIAGFVWWYLR